MPTYEFACAACGERADVRASLAEFDAGLDPACPACGSGDMRRLLSAFATPGASVPAAAPAGGGGGGCCGGGCCAG